jgi:sugar O-acyltransferase (sialic acid O-acetyltransferase NeuD family)
MNEIAIIGAGGHGKVVADLAEICGYSPVFFDDRYPNKLKHEHWPVVGTFDDILGAQAKYANVLVAIGDNHKRMKLSKLLNEECFNLPSLIHPSAIISKYANVESGTIILANVIINAFAKIAKNCIINTGVIVEHDCIIGDSVHLSPRVVLAGGTVVGDFTWVGIGSVSRQLAQIGEDSIVGANSTIIKNIPANVTVFGTPAVTHNIKVL